MFALFTKEKVIPLITILAHGVVSSCYPEFPHCALSPMQYRLLTDPAPIRVCGAPTGAGKTYAFLQGIQQYPGQWVLFIVPTQALARNICAEASKTIAAFVWDGTQRTAITDRGLAVWPEYAQQLDVVQEQGGMIITTPETLSQIWFERPYQENYQGLPLQRLFSATHIVIDEAHLFTERALGLFSVWATLIAGMGQQNPLHSPRLTLLSATHSSLMRQFLEEHVPASLVSIFDETVVPVVSSSSSSLRALHGTVTIAMPDASIDSLIVQHLPSLLARHSRVLIIFDSLFRYSNRAQTIQKILTSHGIDPGTVFVVTGQERQSGVPLDGVNFQAGLEPSPAHRVIIGTSALEVGITYPGVTAAILDVGFTPAALVQRIGRVARGPVNGEILVAHPPASRPIPAQYSTLVDLDGQTLSAEAFREQFFPFVRVSWGHARALASAYWSMMQQQRAPAYPVFQEFFAALSGHRAPSGWLYHLRQTLDQERLLSSAARRAYTRWLDGVESALKDVRGFSPTVRLQFANVRPIRVPRSWALWFLRSPDAIDPQDANLWIYHDSRDNCLLEYPARQLHVRCVVPTIHQFLDVFIPYGVPLERQALELITHDVRINNDVNRPLWRDTLRFMNATGLVVWDHGNTMPNTFASLQI